MAWYGQGAHGLHVDNSCMCDIKTIQALRGDDAVTFGGVVVGTCSGVV